MKNRQWLYIQLLQVALGGKYPNYFLCGLKKDWGIFMVKAMVLL
ncbi:hypothetical protein [Mucilaginibacter phenanthrenivorans]|nr:hypothetical protein [Mucilaginibacter phenanthrenivorans]